MSTRQEDIERLTAAVEERLGLALDPARAEAVIAKRGRAVAERAGADPSVMRTVVPDITIGETYFFRHQEQLDAFRDVALGSRWNQGHVRVMSAGCSSGEEPYSLAMIARDLTAKRGTGPRVQIEAFDASEVALRKAQRARYTRWSLRSTPPEIERKYFVEQGAELVLAPVIRDAVTFSRASLLDPLALPAQAFDVVFCRNVLIYFTPAALATALERLAKSLAPGGYLFLGHAEILRSPPPGLGVCDSHGTFYYRRGEGTRVSLAVPAAEGDTSWFTSIADSHERVRALTTPRLEEVPAQGSSPIADNILEAARIAIRREDFTGALAALDRVEQQRDPQVILLRAIALTEHGDLARSMAACDELLASGNHVEVGHYLRAIHHESEGDLGAALHHARRAVELAPSFAMAHLRLGLIARRVGEAQVARAELTLAIETLAVEAADRIALLAGGLGRESLVRLCRAELATLEDSLRPREDEA